MKKISSGKLQELYLEQDADTILRYTNIRRFVIANQIDHILECNIILIDPAEFIERVNPKNYTEHSQMPRLRTLKKCVELWNVRYKRWQIDKHDIEYLIQEGMVTAFKHGNRWILNCDEVFEVLRDYVKTYRGHPLAKRKKHIK